MRKPSQETKTILKKGDRVRLRRCGDDGDQWVLGKVDLASANGQSVMVILESAARSHKGIYLNAIPLLINYEQETISDFTGTQYELDVYAPK